MSWEEFMSTVEGWKREFYRKILEKVKSITYGNRYKTLVKAVKHPTVMASSQPPTRSWSQSLESGVRRLNRTLARGGD
jgi:hypothetical protein